MFGRNIDKNKIEVKVKIEHFFVNAFKKFHITIWSYMKLKDVLEILLMLMPKIFVGQFVFIWGCEQCSKKFNIISPSSYYYLKDLQHVYYVCCGLPYGKENQTLLIDDEPSKVFQNPKRSGLFMESFIVHDNH
jgi:hypothetical protein